MLIGIVVIGLPLSAILASLVFSEWLRRHADSRTLRSLDEAPRDALIVVLGCKPRQASGRLTHYFICRVASGAAAYHHESSRQLLCTGRVYNDLNEATELAEALEIASVPRAQIFVDSNSIRTIDSIEHVAKRYPDLPILFVTQSFHLPRTLFLARQKKLDAWGLLARGPNPGHWGQFRERIAQARALFDVARSKAANR
ncbi:MAG TPA: hypothetical protein EYG08_01365 [Myxococcales bacterium]|nr:hypothetical protein [Myxococcales bacterium]